jgi:hypothetical protein
MSLDIKKSLELQKLVLGTTRIESRNCRFDNNDKVVSRSASMTSEGETVVYNKKTLTPEQMIELQKMIIGD